MKAIIISSLLFFSLRAMSAEVGENKKADCPAINSKMVKDVAPSSDKKEEQKPAKTKSV